MLWLIALIIPLLFLFSVNLTKTQYTKLPLQLVAIFQKKTIRRKFIGRFTSMIMVVGFFPLVTLAIYLLINQLFGSDPYFFKKSEFLRTQKFSINQFDLATSEISFDLLAQNSYTFLVYVIGLLMLFFLQYFRNLKNWLLHGLFISTPIFLILALKQSHIATLNLSYFGLFYGVALASIVSYYRGGNHSEEKHQWQWIYLVVLTLSIYGEYHYFKNSIHPSEKEFHQALMNKQPSEFSSGMKEVSFFIKNNINEDSKILCDNDLFYPVMVLSEKTPSYFYQLTDTYEAALRYPNLYVDYIIVAHPETFYYRNDKMKALVTAIHAGNYNTQLNHKIVFSNSFVQIIKLVRFENYASNE